MRRLNIFALVFLVACWTSCSFAGLSGLTYTGVNVALPGDLQQLGSLSSVFLLLKIFLLVCSQHHLAPIFR
jgi:hypothetical protein